MKLLFAAVIVATLATPAAAQTDAKRLYDEGQAAYDAGRFDDALAAWTASYQQSQLPALLFNIGQAHRLRARLGDCTAAIAQYRRFVELDPSSPQRTIAEGFIGELGPCASAEATPAAPPPPAEVPTSRRDRKRIASYALAGAGVASIVTGLYFGTKASTLADEVSEACAQGCDWNVVAGKDEAGRSAARTQWIFYGVGAAAVATGTVLFVMSSRERSRPSVTVAPTRGGAAIAWSATW